MDYICQYSSPLGDISLASDGEALTGLWFRGQKHFAEAPGEAREDKSLPVFRDAERWLDIYFGGKAPDFTPPLRPRGSLFRQLIWTLLLSIPYGQTRTYGQLAEEAAERMTRPRMSAQAVGGAAGHNRICLIIPCHRLVGADGSLTGYAGGLEKKALLLSLEGADMSGLSIPDGLIP